MVSASRRHPPSVDVVVNQTPDGGGRLCRPDICITPLLAVLPVIKVKFRPFPRRLKTLQLAFFGIGPAFANAISVERMDTQAQINLYETLTRELGLTEREIMAHLPPSLGNIAREIGLHPTLKLIAHARGKQIYLPVVVTDDCRIARLIGMEAATKVVKILGEARHVVISNPFNSRFMVRRRAINAIRDGRSLNDVVSEHGVSFNSVRNWLKAEGVTRNSVRPLQH